MKYQGRYDIFNPEQIITYPVSERTNKVKLNNKELSADDYIVKGAVPFLTTLKNKGIKLYMASGTDKEDVINEAEVLGYAHLFDGGIYGSVGDVKKYSKKIVIDKIITDNNLKGTELLVTGDGTVEIKECIKFEGIAIGIASDEVRRYDLNEEKRTRLIKAGADIIISDFSQADKLVKLLFKK